MAASVNSDSLRESIHAALIKAVADSKSPGAVAYVGDVKNNYFFEATGNRQLVPKPLPAEKNTVYDLASLTKVVATTTCLMLLYEEGRIDLDAPIDTYLPIPAFHQFTVRQCLTHTAGLVALMPYYKDLSSLDTMLQRYAALPLEWKPGTRLLYSDVGFMTLGRVVELVARDSLDAFARKRIFAPLKMIDTMYKPTKALAVRCAPTEQDDWRKKMMVGQVHDENAYAVGGVAGHAGLFSTAEDLATFIRALLTGKILKTETLDQMLKLGQTSVWPWQGLGWQIDPWASKNWGFLTSRTAFGHSGWTGTSIWTDRDTGLFAILLSNTCHPTRAHRDNETLREEFHAPVSRFFYPKSTNTHSGLDRIVREDFENLRGKRIALLTHYAAVDQLGRPIRDVFALAPDIAVKTIFSPEHGFSGQAEAGQKVASEKNAVPIISLYGDRTAPKKEELKGIDYFIIDLQDVGARYYTYASTMKACMRACGEVGVPVVVLDRPNPVGGTILEGPIANTTDSQVCWGQVPARHGMTMGEIALHFKNTEPGVSQHVNVSALDSWTPNRYFDQCSLFWLAPSPNIPSVETAILYTGMCLFEGTNLNEGRGTETPFQVIGAPWLHAQDVIASIPAEERAGINLEAVNYTPRSIPGKATSPRFQDEECVGIRVTVTDCAIARPFTLAVALIAAINRQHKGRFKWTRTFDVLAGTEELRARIHAGDSASTIVASYADAIASFDAVRPKLYTDQSKKR